MNSTSRVASTACHLGVLAVAFSVTGPMAAYSELFSAATGFGIYTIGLALALLSLLVGLIGLWHTRPGTDRSGRLHALCAVGVGLLLATVVALSLGSLANVPAINDITTDPDDPPHFDYSQRTESDRDFRYPGEVFARQQRIAYPDLKPILLERSREVAFGDAEAAATALGWKIGYRDADRGRIEATATSGIFRFIDDIAIRVRSTNDGTVVDIRSKSRIGRGDLGANAARIRAFRERL